MDRVTKLKEVFTALNNNEVSYCVLRNYEFLLEGRDPNKHSERSVDLVVSLRDYGKWHDILLRLGFKRRKKPSFSLKHVPYYFIENGEVVSFDLQVGGVHWNDMCYLDVVGNRVKKSFFYVPSDNDTFVMLLAHSILGKRYFKSEYKEILLKLIDSVDENYVLEKLSKIFNQKRARWLYNYVKENNFKSILKKKYSLVLYFIFKSMNHLSTFTKLFFRWIKWKKIGKSYPLISFIGPDGGGKSSMSKMLVSTLQERGKKASLVYTGRGRGQLLPIRKLGNKYKSKERKEDRVRTPSRKGKYFRRVLYFIAAPIFAVDLLLRYYLTLLPKRKWKEIIITDRYCTDILLMENVPLWMRRFLLSLFPKPTFTFYLYNTVEVLNKRRPEESVKGLERQLKIFGNLGPYLRATALKSVDKSVNFNIISKKVIGHLLDEWY